MEFLNLQNGYLFENVCSHCFRLAIGLTIEGQIRINQSERVNFHLERIRIMKLYKGQRVIRVIRRFEDCVLKLLGQR